MSEVALKVAMACEVRCWLACFFPPPLVPAGTTGSAAGSDRSTAAAQLLCGPPSDAANPVPRPPPPPPPTHTHHHVVQGCVGAVRRVAEKLPGVEAVDIDLASQKVTVRGAGLDPAAVKEGVAKSGKATELWQ